jgi:CHAT domain-containing protein
MNKITKFQHNFCCSFSRVSRYGVTGLMVVVLLSDAVGAKVGNSQNYSPKISTEILLDKYRYNLPSLADGDKQVLLKNYQNQQQIYLAQQPASTPSIPLNAEQQKLYQQGVKLVQEGKDLEKKVNRESYEQAINKYQQALEIAQKLGLQREEVEILVYIGRVYSSISEEQTTLDYLAQALKKSQQLKPSYKAGILGYIGSIYTNIGRLDDALSNLKKAQSIFLEQNKLEPDELGLLASSYKSMAIVYNKKGEPEKALISLEQALKIYRDTLKSLAGQADVLEDIGFIHSLRGETSKAFEKYNQVLAILEKGNDLPAQAEILERIASLHSKLGKYQQALKDLYKALKLLQQKEGTSIQQGTTITRIADTYDSLGDYQTAIRYYQEARDIYLKAGDTYLGSLTSITIASIYTSFIGDYQKALDYLDNALTFKADNKELLAWIMQEKADIYVSQSDYQNAFNEYNKVLEIQHSIQNSKSEAMTFKKLALLYKLLGDYESSLHNFNKALNIYKQIKDKPQQAITLGFIGSIYETAGKYDESLQFYEQALSLLNKESYQSEILTLQGMVRTYNSLKNYPKALETAEKVLALSKDKGKYEETRSRSVLANVFFSKGDYKQALENYQKVLESFQQLGLLFEEADAWSNIGMTYTLSKQYQQAINTFNKELKLRRTLKNGTDEANALYNIAINQRNLGKLEAALPNIQAAIKIVENIRGKVQSDELRTSYFATVQNYYKFYIDLLMQLHKKDPSKGYNAQALHMSERSRARSLVELLTEANAKIRKNVDPKLLAEESSLLQKIDVKAKLLQQLPINNENQAAALKKESDNLLNQYKELQTKIRTTSPKYAAIKYPEPLKLPQIQQQLDKDSLLLQYSLGKERSYLWVVTPNSFNSYELSGREAIEKSARTFQELLRKCQSPVANCQDLPAAQKAKDLQEITQAATQLSKLILAPVADKLGKKRLVIVADGALQEIPFAALSEPNQKSNYQPLLVNHEIVNLPSVTAIAIHRRDLSKRPPSPKTLAVLADPVFEADDERLTGKPPSLAPELNLEHSSLQQARRNLKRTVWGRLKGTFTEAEQILKLVSPDQSLQALGFNANYNWATNQQLKQYRYLLFATHGFADPINPELSGIILSQLDKQGKPQTPGILRLGDIFNLDWNAELVVLSACETGVGKDVQGEGLMGLTRGLMYAGAKTAVVSLWQVNDKATSQLMPQFFTAMLQRKVSPAVALRESQLKLWRQGTWQNPYYWAAFTLQGEWRN